jgi:hypothetical protein
MTRLPASSTPPDWRAFHFHYHASLDRLLLDFIRPRLDTLVRERDIDRFFFVRYGLGGPHVRLRVRVREARAPRVGAWLLARAGEFFARHPSTSPLSGDQIRSIHDSILRADPEESETALYPDNFAREARFEPETDRYGGRALLELALDYFTLSSAGALEFLAAHGREPRARQLPIILQMLFGEAWSFAGDMDELLALLSSSFVSAGPAMAAIVERGDRLFEQRQEVFVRVLQAKLKAPPRGDAGMLLAAAVQRAPRATRLRALSSQLHMTANRLGLSNAEEVYISRMVWRAARASERDMLTRALDRRQLADPDTAGQELGALASAAMDRCLAGSGG